LRVPGPPSCCRDNAPTEIARQAWAHAARFAPPNPDAAHHPSRTSDFLARLHEQHAPRLWVFGHYHRDWTGRAGDTQFVCVGELSYIDVTPDGEIVSAVNARR
jgi:hypothetical protein